MDNQFEAAISMLRARGTVQIEVVIEASDGTTSTRYVSGSVAAFGQNQASGGVSTWVALGNDTSEHPTITWRHDRYHTVSVY